ncbi:MAG: V-type ATP synthase subunit I [Treponema sp.]|nr:V-type ATP synthase subunit I [Treponema sp.]
MKLVELLVLKQDIDRVLKYIGDKGCFQFYSKLPDSIEDDSLENLSDEELIAQKIEKIKSSLECTEYVYRILLWIPKDICDSSSEEMSAITENRIAVRVFEPFEIPDVINGKEKVPVKIHHNKFVRSFERMVFSFGSPLYGTVDPTPFVAVFFTLLFGMMFGDLGQGLVFLLIGILMSKKVIKAGGWNKFSAIFIAIGISSSLMGLLTGEFFSNETLLEPFAKWVTGFFGKPHAPILKVMYTPGGSLKAMFGLFGVAVAFGFIINSIGFIINIINNFRLRKIDKALFGKNGLSGAVFFWYVIALVLRIVIFKHTPRIYDFIILGVSLFFAAFAEPFENLINKKHPVLENGFGTYLISSVVEVIEVFSGMLSNTISFVRVGAFALSHAVLDYMIVILTELVGGELTIPGILILILGNAIIILLEGMIVAIQSIRLQYYEFFSKFFNETGKEFKPYKWR